MVKRPLEVLIAAFALVAALPLFLLAAIGIRLASPGPVLYRARRIARDRRHSVADTPEVPNTPERRQRGYRGREFTLYKFRTMHVANGVVAPITAHNDSRVFRFGAWLRATKIDELPQLINVIKGDMALVGPRPEAPEIVRTYYSVDDRRTLQVPPGLTSPGSLYYYTHCESTLGSGDVSQLYGEQVLPRKLAVDRVYIANGTLFYDLRVILRTIAVILARTMGRQRFPDPPEIALIPPLSDKADTKP